ncbi:MAG: TlpA disulfide reductase family protein [Bacteroidetes bacterium]|jgi:peroxiredoxin|nr:TlpA disulfide reductase family protein [Bacteroidota bacterium]
MSIRSLCLLLCSSFVFSVVAAQDEHPRTPDNRGYIVQVGDRVPAFSLTDLSGTEHTDVTLLGTTYVLQFTASWCGVCRKEMPHLEQAVWQRFRQDDFVLLGVDLDEPRGKVADFARQMAITYPIAPDPDGQVFYSIAAPKSGVTRNVVVDKEGRIVYLTRLFETEEFEAMVDVIDGLLD